MGMCRSGKKERKGQHLKVGKQGTLRSSSDELIFLHINGPVQNVLGVRKGDARKKGK